MHDPEYGHEHAHHTEHSREEALALLKYMIWATVWEEMRKKKFMRRAAFSGRA